MGDVRPADEIVSLLDELAVLIQQVERASLHQAPAIVRERVRAHQAVTQRIMERLGTAISEFVASQPPVELADQVYALVTARLRGWSRTSPVFHHIYSTPRDKPRPYEVLDLLLDRREGGADVAGQILDNYYMNTVAAVAFRLRSERLAQVLAAEVRRREGKRRPVRLLNLHTGAGRELTALARDRALRGMVHVTCLDTDASALRRVKQELGPQMAGRCAFRLGDPMKLVASGTWPDAPYDLIYSLALFDQLNDHQIEPLIAGCHRGLRPGGTLVFGNFASSLPASEYIIALWVGKLDLRRRDEERLRTILARTPFPREAVQVEIDPLQASFLVSATRA